MFNTVFRRTALVIVMIGSFGLISSQVNAQNRPEAKNLPANASLPELIRYALDHQGRIQQALIAEEIGEREIASALSGWFPQVSASANYNRNIVSPTSGTGNQT